MSQQIYMWSLECNSARPFFQWHWFQYFYIHFFYWDFFKSSLKSYKPCFSYKQLI